MQLKIRKWLHNLAGLNDSPHKIAVGMALGIFVGFLPIMGIQMAVVLPFALLFRGNKTAAIGGVWITNPVTVIPIYYINYQVGLLFTSYPPLSQTYFTDLFTRLSMSSFLKLGADILVPIVVGGAILATVLSIPTYFGTRWFVVRYRERRARKNEKRAERAE